MVGDGTRGSQAVMGRTYGLDTKLKGELDGVGNGQGLTRGVKYLICNFVPRDRLHSSRWVKMMRVQFTLTNIYRAPRDKPRTLCCRDKHTWSLPSRS